MSCVRDACALVDCYLMLWADEGRAEWRWRCLLGEVAGRLALPRCGARPGAGSTPRATLTK
eukprot:6181828-Pleurochrysis_carterae.AAC.5